MPAPKSCALAVNEHCCCPLVAGTCNLLPAAVVVCPFLLPACHAHAAEQYNATAQQLVQQQQLQQQQQEGSSGSRGQHRQQPPFPDCELGVGRVMGLHVRMSIQHRSCYSSSSSPFNISSSSSTLVRCYKVQERPPPHTPVPGLHLPSCLQQQRWLQQ